MNFLSTLLTAVLITIALTPPLRAFALRYQLVDLPNERKVHVTPTPRVGGIAMALGVFAPLCYWLSPAPFLTGYLAGGGLLVLFGAIDDFRDLPPRIKLTAQTAAALCAVCLGGIRIENLGALAPENLLLPSWLGVPLTVFVIVGVTNAINLSDGLDGLAGGISLLIVSGTGYLAYLDGSVAVGLISLALGGALFGFLRFNTHPASVFMGDAGSQFLGFSVVTLSLALTQGRSTPLSPLLPLILLGFPILDTLTVMVTRISQGRSPFSADKNHFHHNLMALGFLHSESVLIIYLFQSLLLLAAVRFRYQSDWVLAAGYLLFSAALLFGFYRAARSGRRFRRLQFFEIQIAGRLRLLKREGRVIRRLFPFFEVVAPLLLFVSCLAAHHPPRYLSVGALAAAGALLVALVTGSPALGRLLRGVLYLGIPFAVYLGSRWFDAARGSVAASLYDGAFAVMAALIVLVPKFSRRRQGFSSSPMDFLIVMIALVLPNLPEQGVRDYRLGMLAARILLLYFSFEVLQAELRGKMKKLTLATVAALVALAC